MPNADHLAPEARDVLDRLAALAEIVAGGDANAAAGAIAELEPRLREIFAKQRDEAMALAEANAHSIELMDQLEEQKEELERARAGLERQAMAAADATVDAMFQMEASEEKATEMEKCAYVDVMTGLFNHRYFKKQINIEFARARRYRRPLCVVFIDIDHFKSLNDTHGHAIGDEVLTLVGKLIHDQVRAADITIRADGDPFAARYGGEEFVVILPETDLAGGHIVAERVRALIESTECPGDETQPLGTVTVSAGVAAFEPTDKDAVSLVKRADEALYTAKHSGRNRVALAAWPLDSEGITAAHSEDPPAWRHDTAEGAVV